jgi:hypothetical protein
MVLECLTRKEAALKAGLTDHALYCALAKPHVAAYRNTVLGVLRNSEAARTISRGVLLADTAQSEAVRNDANKWLAALEGISPIAKSESLNVHNHMHSGLTIVLGAGDPQQHDARLIDGQAHEVRSSVHINRIGQSVPHPNAGNALQIEAKPQANQGPAGVLGGGQK